MPWLIWQILSEEVWPAVSANDRHRNSALLCMGWWILSWDITLSTRLTSEPLCMYLPWNMLSNQKNYVARTFSEGLWLESQGRLGCVLCTWPACDVHMAFMWPEHDLNAICTQFAQDLHLKILTATLENQSLVLSYVAIETRWLP